VKRCSRRHMHRVTDGKDGRHHPADCLFVEAGHEIFTLPRGPLHHSLASALLRIRNTRMPVSAMACLWRHFRVNRKTTFSQVCGALTDTNSSASTSCHAGRQCSACTECGVGVVTAGTGQRRDSDGARSLSGTCAAELCSVQLSDAVKLHSARSVQTFHPVAARQEQRPSEQSVSVTKPHTIHKRAPCFVRAS
jgi:hypothetical protein